MAAPNAKADKFTLSYSLWMGVPILIFDLSEQLDQLFNLYLLVIPLIAIPTLVALIAWLVGLVRNVWLRRWRRVASIMAAPVIALSFFAILSRLGIDSDRVRFELSWSYYLDQVAQIPRVGSEPRFKEFKWGDTGGAGSVIFFAGSYLTRAVPSPRVNTEIRTIDSV